jgi:hypothetical protein
MDEYQKAKAKEDQAKAKLSGAPGLNGKATPVEAPQATI